MYAKQISLIISIIVLLSGSAFAQGEFLRPGEDGFGIASHITGGNNNGGYGLSFGYSIDGALDLAFSYADNTDTEATVYCPSITLYLKGVTDKSVYGLAMTGGYVNTKRGTRNSGSLLIALGLFSNFYTSDVLLVQPSVTGSLAVKADESDDQVVESGTAGLALMFAHTSSFRPFVNASLTVTGDAYYAMGAGFVAAW